MSTTWMKMDPPMVADPREAGLPKWAQAKLAEARRRVEMAERVARDARLATRPEESDAVLDQYGDVPVGLGKAPEVTFRLAGKETVTVRQRRGEPGVLEVSGSSSLAIRPQVSNVVTVAVGRD